MTQQFLVQRDRESAGRRVGQPAGVLVIGLGSPHGDDQIGWLVAGEIARCNPSGVTVRQLTIPIDVLHAAEGFDRVVIIDAVRSEQGTSAAERWEWPAPAIALLRASGTHAIGLSETLCLADQLGQLPGSVIVWGIPARTFLAGSPISSSLVEALPALVETILQHDLIGTEARC